MPSAEDGAPALVAGGVGFSSSRPVAAPRPRETVAVAFDPRPHDQLEVARALRAGMVAAFPHSHVALRGSLADGTADEYSDIDLTWRVQDQPLAHVVDRVPAIASQACGALEWVRADPALHSQHRRLLFLRFKALPLFWRVDLDLHTTTPPTDETPKPSDATDGQTLRRAASALENAIAAVKAVQRGHPDRAQELLLRGYARIDQDNPPSSTELEGALLLAELSAREDPTLESLANQLASFVATARREQPRG